MTDIAINDVTRRVQFTGNTTTGPFAFTFNILTAADIQVFKNNTLQSLTTHYTVSINANGTGSVTMGSALVASDVLTIIGGRAIARTTDFVTAGDLLASSLNEQLDSIVIMAQQLSERVDRAVTAVPGEVVADLSLPDKDARKGTVLGFNSTTGNPEAGPTIADVQSLANITTDIQTLAHIEDGTDATDAIQSVASNSSNINTVAGISSNVSTVAGISSNVTSVAGNASNINTVAGSNANVTTVAGINSDVSTVAGISSNVTTVAANTSEITTVAGQISDVQDLAGITAVHMGLLAPADVRADMAALAESDVITDMAALAETAVIANMAQLGTASVVADIGTLADAQDGTTGTNAITTVATNVTNVNNFANRYRIGSSDPTDSLDAGDLFYNTTLNKLRVYTGSNWIDAGSEHATLNIFEYTATAGQTAFTGNDINGNSLNYSTTAFQVALNGVLLPPEDYTATSATVFTLDSDAAASAGDSLTIYSYSSFALSASPIFATNGNTTVATTTTGFQITNTTDTGTDEALLKLKKVDSSVFDGNHIGAIEFESKTSNGGQDLVYAQIRGVTQDTSTNTSFCDGEVELNVLKGGSLTASQYKFEGELNRLNFASEQKLYWTDHKSTSFDCELDWETPTANRDVKLPDATGTLSHLHIASDGFSNVASKSFSNLSDAYNAYFITFSFLPATDGAHLDLYLGNGSSYLETLSNHYGYAYTDNSSFNSDTSHSSIQIGGNMGSADHEGISGSFIFHNRGFTTSQVRQPPMVHGQYLLRTTGNFPDGGNFYGSISSTQADQVFNGVKFSMSSGNIASGAVQIYGLLSSF